MSVSHPIIAVTGSSGAGTSNVKHAFEDIFRRTNVKPAVIEGDSFHRYNREEMLAAVAQAEAEGRAMTHFGPEANCLDRLERLFQTYSETGRGEKRYYIHDETEAVKFNQPPGTFTEWEELDNDSDLLFYEGLHGGMVTDEVNIAQYTDLLIGVVPVINIEWIQKIKRDCSNRGYSQDAVVDIILKRMPDYIHHITPQFSRTHINFQRVPLIDTSNPFVMREIPTPDESLCVIRFKDPKMADFPYYLSMLKDSFMSRPNNMVVPGTKMGLAIEIILMPFVEEMMQKKRQRG
ncbi:MAG: phosphoribulokinase [Alteromonadaceae bacterium]|jgi:phosphoribulokinase|uniref:phosphoribulokinase n=1 Tax=unclassified Methylophaga TaxID=2629249 RepID=UPI000C61826E|nr:MULTISPECIES: phosphoribulokinase [unclassified Methylophaga]MBN26763.1 phosphoribulokinase [Alteromonadaceae bacterium]MAL49742.1 phosphoribulokinase [Methylophaga sp.]MAP28102.1 phosphoribulokinase [Methylophaga sp.]MBP26021.1 phosphoribulokinase [Methylophaga sp.]HAD31578.1 phosphoribulokinase [Methylophaga sp.]|tara:strand:- start:622 stop:1494 length:873 start_codon:yes stop_codon:yes gene_type:complete